LKKASQEVGVNPQTVKRYVGSALKKSRGRFKAKSSDTLLRVLKIPTKNGVEEIAVRNSRDATLVADLWNAIQRYFDTGQYSALEKLQGKSVKTADGVEVPLLTSRADLKRLGSAGVLFSFESIYSYQTA
jgi:hypothetical protein